MKGPPFQDKLLFVMFHCLVFVKHYVDITDKIKCEASCYFNVGFSMQKMP